MQIINKHVLKTFCWWFETQLFTLCQTFLYSSHAVNWGWSLAPLLSGLHFPQGCLRALMLVSHRSQSPWLRGQRLGLKVRGEPGSSRCQNTSQLSPLFPQLRRSRSSWRRPLLESDREMMERKCVSSHENGHFTCASLFGTLPTIYIKKLLLTAQL